MKSSLTLIGLDIEGPWNVPLLANAADMSGASRQFGKSDDSVGENAAMTEPPTQIDDLLGQFDRVIACEAVPKGRTVYDYPAPRGKIGVIVGNELRGIPGRILKRADQIVSIPMLGRGLSSVNVAAAAAIALYAVERDLGRQRLRASPLSHGDVDLLVLGPPDPSELGSLLRSAWAFGWQRVFLADPSGAWFSKDRPTVLAGRVAARCEVNRIAVSPGEQCHPQEYDRIVICDGTRSGTPLSRFVLPDRGRELLVYGDGVAPFTDGQLDANGAVELVYVDHVAAVAPRFRNAGSIFLSMISHQMRRGRRG